MSELKAFQVEVTSQEDDAHQIFFVAAETSEAATEALTGHLGVLPEPSSSSAH